MTGLADSQVIFLEVMSFLERWKVFNVNIDYEIHVGLNCSYLVLTNRLPLDKQKYSSSR